MTSTPTNNSDSTSGGKGPGDAPETIFLTVGRIVAAQGLRGELRMSLITDRPEALADLDGVYLGDRRQFTSLLSFRLHSNGRQAVLRITGVDDRSAAEELKGTLVQVRADQLPPPEEDAYYHYQILGLTGVLEDGTVIGECTDIIEAGEVDVYVFTDAAGKQQLYPALREVIIEIDLEAGTMTIRPQEWNN